MPADPDAKTPAFHQPVPAQTRKSPKQIMEENMAEGLALRGFQMGLGYDTAHALTQQPVKATESTSLNVGDLFKGMADLNSTLASKLLEKRDQADNPSDARLFTFLLAQLDRMQQRQDAALNNQQQQDPLSVALDFLEKYKQMGNVLQSHEPPNLQLAQAGMNIESLKIQAQMQQGQHQHEEHMETMKHQWQREDERWRQEFGLKLRESDAGQKRAEQAGGMLEDLANSFADSLEPGGGGQGVAAAAPQPRVSRPPARLKTFRCQPPHGCGAIVQVASPQATEATCATCGLIWDLYGNSPPPMEEAIRPPPSTPPPDIAAVGLDLAEEERERE